MFTLVYFVNYVNKTKWNKHYFIVSRRRMINFYINLIKLKFTIDNFFSNRTLRNIIQMKLFYYCDILVKITIFTSS